MPLGMFRLGILAWDRRHGAGRVLVWAVAAVMALPVVLAVAVVAAFAGLSPSPGSAGGSTVRPLSSWVVSQGYGCTGLLFEPARGGCAHFHFGIDLVAPAGSAVSAVAAGQIEILPAAGYGGGYGLHVVVHHGEGRDTMYAHLEDVAVLSGQAVPAGATLGHQGSSGLSTGPHLHFEVREAGIAVDPISVFPGLFGPEGQPR